MPVTIIVEDGTRIANANSFLSLADANTFFEGHTNAAAWTAATDDQKKAALVTATRLLDSYFQFIGFKTSDSQALQWPRVEALDINQYSGDLYHDPINNINSGYFDEDEIPRVLIDAECEFARYLLEGNRLGDTAGKGIREFELTGAMRVEYQQDNLQTLMPDMIVTMLDPIASVRDGKSSVVKLTRA